MSKDLEELRAGLDEVDRKLVDALAERGALVEQVARLKAEAGRAVRDPARERELLAKLVDQGKAAGLDAFYVTRLFREILDHSVRQQELLQPHTAEGASGEARTVVVGYQGGEGAFSHMAATRHFGAWGEDVVYQGFPNFTAMLEAVKHDRLDYAVLPIENSIAGSINESYDLLARMDLALVGEEVQRVVHCLIALEDIPLSRIRRVYSHPVALAQCGDFLATLANCHVEAYGDTALSVAKIKDEQDLSQAAIASEEAARVHGLPVIKRDVADQRENYTRMVVVAKAPVTYELRIPCKTSLIFSTRHEQGALFGCIQTLAQRGLNLTKLESRPKRNTPWEYVFYVDFEGNVADPKVAEALEELASHTSFLKVLGSYPARTTKQARPVEPKARVAAKKGGRRGGAARAVADVAVEQHLERRPYRLASRATRAEDTRIAVGDLVVGSERPVLAIGPAVVESAEQIRACAEVAREVGADVLRGGCFQSRGGPAGFEGLRYEGLELLGEAGHAAGLPILVEVLDAADVEKVARKADLLEIGAHNMQNDGLLAEVGKVDRPVLLRRALTATVDEWLAAAEYVLSHGNQQVILCEAGIRTFVDATPATLDLSSIPIVRERSHLPVLVDPSRALGTARWVPALAEAGIAAGAHGVILTVHPEPSRAKGAPGETLSFDALRALVPHLRGAP